MLINFLLLQSLEQEEKAVEKKPYVAWWSMVGWLSSVLFKLLGGGGGLQLFFIVGSGALKFGENLKGKSSIFSGENFQLNEIFLLSHIQNFSTVNILKFRTLALSLYKYNVGYQDWNSSSSS